MREDRGAGSVLGVALVGVVVSTVALLLPLYSAVNATSRARAAADAAALAAADVAIGIVAGTPCVMAASVAAANGAVVTECQADGVIVTVRVSVAILGFPVSATATAGPPDSQG